MELRREGRLRVGAPEVVAEVELAVARRRGRADRVLLHLGLEQLVEFMQ
jgi:hypothetical protein